MTTLLSLRTFRKFQELFSKNLFFQKKCDFCTVREIVLFQSHFVANLLPSRFLRASKIFFRETHALSLKNSYLKSFKISHHYKQVVRQNSYLQGVLESFTFFFEKLFFRKRTLNFARVEK